jgi:anti-anti-sigma factor
MSKLAKISHESAGVVEVARVDGDIDASNVEALSESLLGSIPNSARALVLDLSNTTYIDSSGVSLIFDVATRLRNRRQKLRLVVVPRSFVAEVLAAVKLEDMVPIDPAMSDALKAVGVG